MKKGVRTEVGKLGGRAGGWTMVYSHGASKECTETERFKKKGCGREEKLRELSIPAR